MADGFEARVEIGALEILNARLRKNAHAEFTLEEAQALPVVWPAVVEDARAILLATDPMLREEHAKIAETLPTLAAWFPGEGQNQPNVYPTVHGNAIATAIRQSGGQT